MSPNLTIMSANLASMASALAAMSSNLATMSSDLATIASTEATSNVTSAAPPAAQQGGSEPAQQTVYVLTYSANDWQGTVDSPGGERSLNQKVYKAQGTLGVYLPLALAKKAGMDWLIEAMSKRSKALGNGKYDAPAGFETTETDESGVWEAGWIEHGEKFDFSLERLKVRVVGRVLQTGNGGSDGGDGRGEGTDGGQGVSDEGVGEEEGGR